MLMASIPKFDEEKWECDNCKQLNNENATVCEKCNQSKKADPLPNEISNFGEILGGG